jgi:hypothetical protein
VQLQKAPVPFHDIITAFETINVPMDVVFALQEHCVLKYIISKNNMYNPISTECLSAKKSNNIAFFEIVTAHSL